MAMLQAEPVGADSGRMRAPASPDGGLAGVSLREARGRPARADHAAARARGQRAQGPSHEEMLRVRLTGRRMLLFGTFVLAALAFLYFVLPQLGGVKHTWDRLNEGDAWWIAVAVVVEVVSMASYIAIFQGVHVPQGSPIRWRHSYQITMAGLAATRLFAAGGAGGVAVTAWSLRRSGMEGREVAQRMIAFLVLLYGVYMAALVVCGVGLYTGVFPGPAPVRDHDRPGDRGRGRPGGDLRLGLRATRLGAASERSGAPARVADRPAGGAPAGEVCDGHGRDVGWGALRHAEAAPSGMGAVRGARRGGASTWRCLYACFRAFGEAPPVAVLVQAYFVGMLANLLPLPGGIGGVDGGMIGALGGLRRGRRAGVDRGAGVPPAGVLAAEHPGRDRLLPAAPHGRPLGAARRGPIAERRTGAVPAA